MKQNKNRSVYMSMEGHRVWFGRRNAYLVCMHHWSSQRREKQEKQNTSTSTISIGMQRLRHSELQHKPLGTSCWVQTTYSPMLLQWPPTLQVHSDVFTSNASTVPPPKNTSAPIHQPRVEETYHISYNNATLLHSPKESRGPITNNP